MLRNNIKYCVMFGLMLLLFAILTVPAAAESSNIKVTIEEGLDGKIKRGKGFPLLVKLENNGEAFSGDMLIDFRPSYNTGGSVLIHVELSGNTSKTYHVSVAGLTEDQPAQNSSSIHLYKGNWKKGNDVSFTGDKTIKPRYINEGDQVIGVLSENYDRLKELRTLPSIPIQMLSLKKEQLPSQAIGLEMIDYLVIDEYDLSQLEDTQEKAIADWVQSGGVLVAGAAPDANQTYGFLYTLLPMKYENESVGTTDFLHTPKNDQTPFNEINFYTGAVEKGASILEKTGNLPAAVKKQYGNGTILQTSFSLGDQPLSGWSGYSAWFDSFINQADKNNAISSKYGPEFYDPLYWEFAETNEFFSASNFSVTQLIIIILIYVIVIVPVLYIILRKIDKREHSWWIIPSVAMIMSVIVFGLGAKDRIGEPQLNQMGVYKVKDQQLIGFQASTLLSNRSGEYKLSIPKGQFNAVPSTNNATGIDPKSGAVFEEKRKTDEITFNEVGYWSSKTIYGKSLKQADGDFTANLTIKDGDLTGTIQNGFPYDFEELFILSGNKKIEIGQLKKGQTLKVDKKVEQQMLTGPTATGNSGMNPMQQTDLDKLKKEKLRDVASSFLFESTQSANNEPLIGGITRDVVVNVQMPGKNEKQNNLNLILSPFVAESELTGPITLTMEMLGTKLEPISGYIHEQGMNGKKNEVMIEDGEYDYIVQLPQQMSKEKMNLESVKLMISGQFAQYSILNRKTGQYLPLEDSQKTITLNKENHVDEFFSKQGELLIKVYKNSKGDPYLMLPTVTVKGEVTT